MTVDRESIKGVDSCQDPSFVSPLPASLAFLLGLFTGTVVGELVAWYVVGWVR